MRILISNDDGIYSPGIVHLAKAAARFGEVRVVAPDVEQSSMSHAITSSRPLRFKRIHIAQFDAYSVNGTPADCVALGMHRWGHVDLVLSGINLGLNLGNSLWHSGTLAAAKQAALLGARGIAFSTHVAENHDPDATDAAGEVEWHLRRGGDQAKGSHRLVRKRAATHRGNTCQELSSREGHGFLPRSQALRLISFF